MICFQSYGLNKELLVWSMTEKYRCWNGNWPKEIILKNFSNSFDKKETKNLKKGVILLFVFRISIRPFQQIFKALFHILILLCPESLASSMRLTRLLVISLKSFQQDIVSIDG